MKNLKSKKAFNLAEAVIVLLIISLIVLLSTSVLKKKTVKKNNQTTHGTYACTIFDNTNYYFVSNVKDAELPKNKSGWSRGSCGTGFKMPVKSGLMTVKVMGGGGAGGDASVEWYDSVMPQTFTNSGSYVIPRSGYYDISVIGTKGGSSSINSWKIKIDGKQNQCFAQTSPGGDNAYFVGTIYLTQNDKLSISYETSIIPSLNLTCNPKITPEGYPGSNGRDIIIKRNSSNLLLVEGSKAGTYYCNSSELCSKHYDAIEGEKGKITVYGSFSDKQESYGSSASDYGTVSIKWSDKNNSIRSFKPKAGCGGTAGEIQSTLYPILRDKLPSIKIGRGGTSDLEAEPSTFGSLRASAGRNNVVCSSDLNNMNGMDGKDFVLNDFSSKGGLGGKSMNAQDTVNGQSSSGFVSGGGGGAIWYDSSNPPSYDSSVTYEENKKPVLNGVRRWYQGKGGNGGSGLLILTW